MALAWKLVKSGSIPIDVKFPRIGWLNLGSKEELDLLRQDTADLFEEGRRRLRKHIQIECNAKLRRKSREWWQRKLGGLRCLACKFDFVECYGEHGSGFIEMHHKDSLGSGKGPMRVGVQDLIPLCSNCHRMIHYKTQEALSLNHLKKLIR